MAFTDYIEKIKQAFMGETKPVVSSSGRGAVYSQFGSDIYASEIIQQSARCVANEMKKLKPKHVINSFEQVIEVRDDISRILAYPNELMTISEFIETCTYRLLAKSNVFIYPTWVPDGAGGRKYTGLYPLKPSQVDFVEDATGRLFIQFKFNNGSEVTLPYSDVIHWRYDFGTDDFMGGNAQGESNVKSLIETLQLDKSVRDSMKKAANAPVNGVVKYGSVISENKLSDEVSKFNKQLRDNESGILAIDAKSEFQQMARNIAVVDAATMEFIKQEIVDHFGVSLPMLHSIATVEEKQSFYDKTIEPLVITLNQAFTRCLISGGKRDRFHEIIFYEKDLLFMTMEQKINLVDAVKDLGIFTNNQILGIFGFPPYEGGNVRVRSLNNIDSSVANEYQVGETGSGNDNQPSNEGEADEKQVEE